MPDGQAQQISVLSWLLQSNYSLALLGLGLILAIAGIILIIFPNRSASVVIAGLSFLPGLIGLVMVYSAATAFSTLAGSPEPPKPTEFAKVINQALYSGFFSLIATLLAMFFSVVALVRSSRPAKSRSGEPEN
ncbi:hypothetical protein [Blastopirellula marina]|uniref:MotA/TolQ/ExbB proton channel domain-containing protein n=1 Tax=Blastopirellula marina TaxID=124 RepID=A0A2S8GEY2_9BACT|nr:hypothetical protein [Blastopirellula marina]PQO42973.1 hypothetical protein C5Y93_24960 [Blastopirellula marina]